jgi:hypothetical protein
MAITDLGKEKENDRSKKKTLRSLESRKIMAGMSLSHKSAVYSAGLCQMGLPVLLIKISQTPMKRKRQDQLLYTVRISLSRNSLLRPRVK